MSDHHERACMYCGSFLHHEDDCPNRAEAVERWWQEDVAVEDFEEARADSMNQP